MPQFHFKESLPLLLLWELNFLMLVLLFSRIWLHPIFCLKFPHEQTEELLNSKVSTITVRPAKVTHIHWNDWVDDAEKSQGSRRNLLSFHLRTCTFSTLDGNGDVDYYCFIVVLGIKGDSHDILELKFNMELKVQQVLPWALQSKFDGGSIFGCFHLR
jgi:hypothetical protein